MAGSKSAYLEKVVLDTFIGGQAFTPPANLYIALYTSGALTDQSTGTTPVATEVTGGAYARAVVANNLTQWPAATEDAVVLPNAESKKTNANTITFATATADWGTISSWAIVDAATNGNIYYYGTFNVAKTILNGDTATLPPGALVIYEQ